MADCVPSGPVLTPLEPERVYAWCACGKSQMAPFCDGSHKGTEMYSLKFSVESAGTKALCTCRKTSSPPFCDGSHLV